jgi:LmbE family N-acetylglucosaminyl deacetylase
MNPTVTDSSLFANPQAIPLQSITEILAESVLVVAPHPDDETLGCAGAIKLLCLLGKTVQILVMSDGTQSHPNSRKYPTHALKHLREEETCRAMAMLGVKSSCITFFQLRDGSIPASESEGFNAAVYRLQNYLNVIKPKTVFAPWRSDPHPDHRATWQMLHAALQQLSLSPRVIEYPIWDWDPVQRQCSQQGFSRAWRLDISAVLEDKKQAIAAYRSQTTDLIDDDPTGFRLTAQMLSNFAQPWEVYLEE